MKRVIRLTESDLTRIVRRVIKEQETSGEALKYDGIALKILGMLDKSINRLGTDPDMIADAIKMIPQSGDGKRVYDSLLKLVQKGQKTKDAFGRNFDTVMDLIQIDFSKIDLREPSGSSNDVWLNSYSSILKQYNKNELPSTTSSHMEG